MLLIPISLRDILNVKETSPVSPTEQHTGTVGEKLLSDLFSRWHFK